MHPFELYLPTRLIFGKDSIKRLPDVLSGHTNILLTYGGGSIKRSGIYDKVKALLSDKHICELSGIAPNPKVQSARDGVRIARENHVDAILAVGGGSVLDLSKLISAAISYEGDPWELVLDPSKITKTPVPLFDVLTLTATGSEYDNSGVISNPDTDEKMPIFGNLNPVASILDPTYTFTVNAWQTASGSADIMSHTFESYLVAEGTTLTDGLCEAMLRTVIKNTPIAIKHPDDYDARAELMQAASFGCCGILADGMTPSPWVCHGIEHEISAFHDITHGAGLAVITPHWMRFSLTPKTAERFKQYGVNVWGLDPNGDPMKVGAQAIDKTAEFFKSIGLPSRLSEMGVTDEHFEQMADHVLKIWFGDFKTAIRPLGRQDIIDILKASL
ncbi:MAG: iron-containing alcohol dehydrogenase [Aeromonadales bacterium]|nr:iron-containing alcohol dehydrogenase [Aeromonadales bacterium]MDY2890896.1 iron-containing alcohol dehydrogenase [Succinivibrio sp.]